MSQSPGITVLPAACTTVACFATVTRFDGPTAVIRPSRITTVPFGTGFRPVMSRIVAPTMATSGLAAGLSAAAVSAMAAMPSEAARATSCGMAGFNSGRAASK